MSPLWLHVFGRGYGESLVLALPNGDWGVLDCYAPLSHDSATNEALQFLRRCGVKELAFVGLTHPHDDHVTGLNQLFDCFTVRWFWRFAGFTQADLTRKIMTYLRASSDLVKAREGTVALERLFQQVDHRKAKAGLRERWLIDQQPLYPIPKAVENPVQIRCLGPATDLVTEYEEHLGRAFELDEQGWPVLRADPPQVYPNQISAVLEVTYGATRLILCGDAESRNWEIILIDVGAANLTAAGVKIGHHGATSGYIDGLWPAFSAAGKPVAVLTTWSRGGKTLPQRAALEHLRPHVSRLFTTARDLTRWPSLQPPQPVPSGTLTEDTVVLLDQLFPSLGSPWGVCSLAFDNQGHCVEAQCHGRAAELRLNEG